MASFNRMKHRPKDADRETTRRAVHRAIQKAGGQTALAKLAGVSQQRVSDWLRDGIIGSLDDVLSVEKATGISRHDLAPDLSRAFKRNNP